MINFEHLEYLIELLNRYGFIVLISVLALIFILILWRFFKFRVSMAKPEANVSFDHLYPKMDPNTFLPVGWTRDRDLRILKKACKNHMTYLGWRLKNGVFRKKVVPVLVKDKDRTYHMQIAGTTGSGKTEIILNLLFQDLIKGYGACIVDPKADDDFLERLLPILKKCGLLDQFYLFSFWYPQACHIYNAVQNGTPEEITERIINACNIEVEYYKNVQFNFLLNTIHILRAVKETLTLHDIIDYLKNFKDSEWVKENIVDMTDEDLSTYLKETMKRKNDDVSGILAILNLVADGQFSDIINGKTQIDLKEIINSGKVVLFQIPVNKYGTIGKALGKMILQDIQSVVGGRQSLNVDPTFKRKNFFPVYLDEFFSLAYQNFMELINKARSANNPFVLGHQALSDLSSVSKEFKEGVFENTNLKIVSKQNDPASCEEFAMRFGTYTSHKETQAVKKGLIFNKSQEGSLREVEEFIIHPNQIKNAKVGQGVNQPRDGQAYLMQYRLFPKDEEMGKIPLKEMLKWIPKRNGNGSKS